MLNAYVTPFTSKDPELTPAASPPLGATGLSFPLTLRGVLVLVFSLWMIIGPAREQADVVASIFGPTLLAVLLVILGVVLIGAYRIRAAIDLQVLPILSANGSQPESNALLCLPLRCTLPALPPWCVLSLQLKSEQGDLPFAVHQLTGRPKLGQAVLQENHIFPHRGSWSVDYIEAALTDRLGLSSCRWRFAPAAGSAILRAYPPQNTFGRCPIMGSLARDGDSSPSLSAHSGDPLDLRRYHPSDGMSRIVWKLYAKSRTLLARHPERAMTPEGKVLVFCIATKDDDQLAGASLQYLRELEKSEMNIQFGCLGMGDLELAHTSEEARELTVKTAFAAEQPSVEKALGELKHFVTQSSGTSSLNTIERVVLCTSHSMLGEARGLQLCTSLAEWLVTKSIEPVFLILDSPSHYQKNSVVGSSRILSTFETLLVIGQKDSHALDEQAVNKFSTLCRNRGWSVV